MSVTRRSLLKFGAFGIGATAAGLTIPLGQSASTADWISTSAKPRPYTRPLKLPRVLTGTAKTDEYGPYREFVLEQKAANLQILDGTTKTPVLGYAPKGGAVSVPGPVLRVPQNTRVKLRMHNNLPATHPSWGYATNTSLHLHGSASLPQYDGYADDVTKPGQYKDYWYPNHQGPRTLWYHDHGVHHTAQNAYSGLAAQYHLTNPWERANLPTGKYDLALTISDAMFDASGKLAYQDRDHSGLYGDVILVNGTPWPYHNVERRFYRLRILMATLSRSMNLRFVNTRTNATLNAFMVATDGGLMVPQPITSWRHAGAERYEVMIDFSQCAVGDTIELRNSSNKNNVDYLHTGKVMQFRVTSEATQAWTKGVVTPPAAQIHPIMSIPESQSRKRRLIDLEHDDVTNEFMINGQTWEDVRQGQYNLFADGGDPPKPGDVEIWRIENKSGGWFHPLHIHLVDFRILRRIDGVGRVHNYEMGPKDVVYVGESEEIDLLVQYNMAPARYPNGRSTGQAGGALGAQGGRYMIHCHNLPHEDHDMMSQFFVAAADGTVDLSPTHPNHPMYVSRPV